MAKYYSKIGRPDTADGYVKQEAGNEEFMTGLREVFHGAGLTADQGKNITEAISAQFAKDSTAMESMTQTQTDRAFGCFCGVSGHSWGLTLVL